MSITESKIIATLMLLFVCLTTINLLTSDSDRANASDHTIVVCDEEDLQVSISLDRASLNNQDDKHINLHAILRNNGTEECNAAITLSVPEASGLIINPTRSISDEWKYEEGSDFRSVDSISKPLNPGDTRRFNVEIISRWKQPSGSYRISASTAPGQNAAIDSDDWRMIWVSNSPPTKSNDPVLRECRKSTPVISRNLQYDSGTIITPLTLSFDCEFGYTIFDVRIQGAKTNDQLRLQPRGSGVNSEPIHSFTPYFATPEHKDSLRYTVVFDGLPKKVRGLKLVSISESETGGYAEQTRELVPYAPGFSDKVRTQLTDAYESSIEFNIIGPLLYVSGITSAIFIWLMLVPIGPGGWSGTPYRWSPIGILWTLASVALVIGSATLVSLSLFTVLVSGISDHTGGTIVAGALLTLIGIWIILMFSITAIRKRLHSKATQRASGTLLPWWLQDPIHGPPSRNALTKQSVGYRNDGNRSLFSRIFGKKRRNYRKSSKTDKVNWRWVYLLSIAGAMSIASIAILTP